MTLHHVGIVVKSIESRAAACLRHLTLSPDSPVFLDPLQKVRLQFWKDQNGGLLELIEPASQDSPSWRAAEKGGGLNHLGYEVDDIEREIESALESGAILARDLSPAVAFGGRRVAFLFFRDLGLIEYIERRQT